MIWRYRCIHITCKNAPYENVFFSLFFKDSSAYEEFTRFCSHNPEGIFESLCICLRSHIHAHYEQCNDRV